MNSNQIDVIKDQLNFIGISIDIDSDINRFILKLNTRNSTQTNLTQIEVMSIINETRYVNYSGCLSLTILPYRDNDIVVEVKNSRPGIKMDYFLGFLQNLTIYLYLALGKGIDEYYSSKRTISNETNGKLPTQKNFLYRDKIAELDHVKTTFICPSCFGRVSFNLWSDTKYNITSDIEDFDIERCRTTFIPTCKLCDQSMFECDEDFVDRIIKLNLLGICTEYCCSGHKEEYDEVRTNGNKTKNTPITGIALPYLVINLFKTGDPHKINEILTIALQCESNVEVSFIQEDPFLRIGPKLCKNLDDITIGTIPELKEILFKFVDEIIRRFDKEGK